MDLKSLDKKFTQGDWGVVLADDTDGKILFYKIQLKDRNQFFMASHANPYLNISHETALANAMLAAAAPDLLEACRAMLSRFEHSETDMIKADHVKELARKAIAKALTISGHDS
jgi:hypothetical protein